MNEKININYVGVVKENNGSYTYEQVVIKQSEGLINALTAMVENPNRTVLDLQDCFRSHFGRYPRTMFNYCLPYSYDASYIGCITLPKMISADVYQQNKRNTINNARKEEEDRAKSNSMYVVTTESIAQYINKCVAAWNEDLKREFMREAMRYIKAVDFAATIDCIKRDSTVKMFSHENVGWTTLNHQISDDLVVSISTNFGYGASSYFLLNVSYKGIDLLPYSHLVKYYGANIAEIKRCSRSYYAQRDNWALAMDFVAEMSSQAKAGELSFARNWLKSEIDEMMSRLYAINANPLSSLKSISAGSATLRGLCSVRIASNGEKSQMKLYPEEMAMVFKTSKLTAALDLIDKLQKAGEIYEPALEAVDKIIDINRLLVPELEKWLAKIATKLEQLTATLNQYNESMSSIKSMIGKHEEQIAAIFKADANPQKSLYNIAAAYRKNHPEFGVLEQRRDDLSGKISDTNSRIGDYNNFNRILRNCYHRIEEESLLCA